MKFTPPDDVLSDEEHEWIESLDDDETEILQGLLMKIGAEVMRVTHCEYRDRLKKIEEWMERECEDIHDILGDDAA